MREKAITEIIIIRVTAGMIPLIWPPNLHLIDILHRTEAAAARVKKTLFLLLKSDFRW